MALFIAIITPLLACGGAVTGVLLSGRRMDRIDVRAQREEGMRHFRWAAGLAARDEDEMFRLGVEQLRVLAASGVLDPDQAALVTAVRAALVEQRAAAQNPIGNPA